MAQQADTSAPMTQRTPGRPMGMADNAARPAPAPQTWMAVAWNGKRPLAPDMRASGFFVYAAAPGPH